MKGPLRHLRPPGERIVAIQSRDTSPEREGIARDRLGAGGTGVPAPDVRVDPIAELRPEAIATRRDASIAITAQRLVSCTRCDSPT